MFGFKFMKTSYKTIEICQYFSMSFMKEAEGLSAISTEDSFTTEFLERNIQHQVRHSFINFIYFIAVESNGILLGEFQPRKWYFLATEHERPSFTRSQFSAIINDKQIKSNLSIDYPKIEKNSRLSMMTVCKNFVG